MRYHMVFVSLNKSIPSSSRALTPAAAAAALTALAGTTLQLALQRTR
jgi:hypothetical protein